MVSRANTVNLSNMPVVSEGPCSTGTGSADDSLVSSLSALCIDKEKVDDQWKITHFQKSPPVRNILVLIAQPDACKDVYLPRCLCQRRV